MKKLIALCVASLFLAPPLAAKDVLKYSTTVSGIPLGKVKVVVDTEPSAYRVRAGFSMIPLLRHIFNGDAEADVTGTVAGGRFLPGESVFRYEGRKEDKRIAILFEAGVPVDLEADPPIRKTSYRMSLDEAAGAVDPATAAALLMAPRERPCALTFDIFDGTKRHRISLTGQATATEGNTVTCVGLYERVNGFKAKYMTPERRSWPFRATLMAANGRWVPLKITADTKFGPASATLRR